jgi:8-oxo-dGTP pyrophosphatase MutT (NUDIX family)
MQHSRDNSDRGLTSRPFDPQNWSEHIANRRRSVSATANLRASAVLMPLFWHSGRWNLLFTKRSEEVSSHKGQLCFPGGRQEPSDASLEATALRECEEEIGVPVASVKVIGLLDDIETIWGVRVTPVLAVIPAGLIYTTDPREVATILEVPVAAFLDPTTQRVEEHTGPDGSKRKIYFYEVGGEVVWGATARIVKEWLDLLAAETGLAGAALAALFEAE